jgi:hypothetical protein
MTEMWYWSMWGNWRFKWLYDRQNEAIFLKENIDHLIRQVVSTISWSAPISDQEYDYIIQTLANRAAAPPTNRDVFYTRTRTIKKTMDEVFDNRATISPRAWSVVFYIIKLFNKTYQMTDFTHLDQLKTVIEERAARDRAELYMYHLVAGFYTLLSLYCFNNYNIDFSPEVQPIVDELRQKMFSDRNF